jgi:hypothetical protein
MRSAFAGEKKYGVVELLGLVAETNEVWRHGVSKPIEVRRQGCRTSRGLSKRMHGRYGCGSQSEKTTLIHWQHTNLSILLLRAATLSLASVRRARPHFRLG